MGAGGRGFERRCTSALPVRCRRWAIPGFTRSPWTILQRVAAGLAVTGIGSIAQRFARAVVQHREVGLMLAGAGGLTAPMRSRQRRRFRLVERRRARQGD